MMQGMRWSSSPGRSLWHVFSGFTRSGPRRRFLQRQPRAAALHRTNWQFIQAPALKGRTTMKTETPDPRRARRLRFRIRRSILPAACEARRCSFGEYPGAAGFFRNVPQVTAQYAAGLAEQSGAKLTLLHVLQPPLLRDTGFSVSRLWQDESGCDAIKKLLLAIRSREIPPDVRVDVIVRQSFVFDGIIDAAREIHADLIVVTTRGETGLRHLLLGSTAESIVRLAPCPVLVVR